MAQCYLKDMQLISCKVSICVKIAVLTKFGEKVELQMTTSQIVSMAMLAKASTCGLMSM